MAKFVITRACGHEDTTQIYGKVSERDRKAEYESTKLCHECYMEKLENERAATNAKAAEKAKEQGLPELTGSGKQIAWAESIRAKAIEEIEDLRKQYKNAPEHIVNKFDGILEGITSRTRAGEWIDTRFAQYDTTWLAGELRKSL